MNLPNLTAAAVEYRNERARGESRAVPRYDAPPSPQGSPSLLIWYGELPPPPPPSLIRDTLPETGVAIIGGQFGVGKTFVGAALVASVMTGSAFAGTDVIRSGAVLWLAAEGENEIEGRVRAATEHLIGSAGRQPFARQAGGVPLLTEADALARLKAHVREAEAYAREKFGLPLVLVVVDTLSAAAGFDDENNASETQKVMNLLREISREARALVLVIDHYGKMVDTGIRGILGEERRRRCNLGLPRRP